MSAWTNLLAASSLALGTAWDLITHPRTGGTGTGVVVNTGATAMVNDTSLAVALADTSLAVAATSPPLSVEVLAPRYTVVVSDNRINAALDVA